MKKYYVDLTTCKITDNAKGITIPFVVMLNDDDVYLLTEYLKTKTVLMGKYDNKNKKTQYDILQNLIEVASFIQKKLA